MTDSRAPQPHTRVQARGRTSRVTFFAVLILCLAGIVSVLVMQNQFHDDTPDAQVEDLGGDPILITPTFPPETPDLSLVPTMPPGMIAGQTHTRLQMQSNIFLIDVCATLAAQPASYDMPAADPLHAACAARKDLAPQDATTFYVWASALCAFPALLDDLYLRAAPLPHFQAYVTTLCADLDTSG